MKRSRVLTSLVVFVCLWGATAAAVYAAPHLPDVPAGESGGGHHAENPPQPLSVDPDLAVWTLGVFILLLLVLSKFAWKPIVAALDERENNIAQNIADAARQNDDARQLLVEYERKLAAAQDQVRAILDDSRKDAEKAQQEILAKGRAEAETEMKRAMREIDTAKSVALNELAERSTDLAIDLAGRIVRKELNSADHAQLIQEAVGRFPDAGPSRN